MNIKQLLFTCLLFITTLPAVAQTTKAIDPTADDRGYIIKTGDLAPADFELVLTNGTKTSLTKLRGKVVIPAVYRKLVQRMQRRNAAFGKRDLADL